MSCRSCKEAEQESDIAVDCDNDYNPYGYGCPIRTLPPEMGKVLRMRNVLTTLAHFNIGETIINVFGGMTEEDLQTICLIEKTLTDIRDKTKTKE